VRSVDPCRCSEVTAAACQPIRFRLFGSCRPPRYLAALNARRPSRRDGCLQISEALGNYLTSRRVRIPVNGLHHPLESMTNSRRTTLAVIVVALATLEAVYWVLRLVPPLPLRGITTVSRKLAGTKDFPLMISQSALSSADANSSDWLYATHDYTGQRFSGLRHINAANVHQLEVACTFQLGDPPSFQSNPVVAYGMMFLTTVTTTVAIDAATCTEVWRHERQPTRLSPWRNNRGVAIKDSLVIRGTNDGYLLALDARNGRHIWQRRVANIDDGETITMPPLVFEDLIVVGPAGSEYAISGWIGAFRLRDGKQVWKFKTVLQDSTWGFGKGVDVGGGSVWTPVTLDVKRGTLFVATTNPAPDLVGSVRPGANLYTNSLLALDVRTGSLRWYRQLVPHDVHDWDLTQSGPLFDAMFRGVQRSMIATAGKDGVVRVLDRDTHDVLYETVVSRRENAELPISTTGTFVCPGINGGVLWNGPAYSPDESMLYVPSVDFCGIFTRASLVRSKRGSNSVGGTFGGTRSTWGGALTAVDASDGSIRWRFVSKEPFVGAVTATAGGIVFAGDIAGRFYCFDARSGKILFRHEFAGGIGGGVVTYTANLRQYVAVLSGSASSIFPVARRGRATVTVFAIPRTSSMP
jgi:alcohol dehydrogenase (cytochrome c)